MIIEPTWWNWATLAAGALLTALILAVGHWFPWPRPLEQIHCYVYGVLSILAGFTLWRGLNADWVTPVGLFIVSGTGGLTVILAYKIDGWVKDIRKGHKAETTDEGLTG